MTERTEAQRLADALMEPVVLDKHAMEAAACLRRLDADNAALRDALSDAEMSLNTIAILSGRDEYLEDVIQVRDYASRRRDVIRAALSGTAPARTGDAA